MAGDDRERDVDGATRSQMMQNLFGDQSEDDDDEEPLEIVDEDDQQPPQQQQQRHHHDLDQEEDDDEEDDGRSHVHGHAHDPYHSEEGEGEAEHGGEGEAEGEGESEGQIGMEEESEGEVHPADLDQGESDAEKVQSSPERELSDGVMQTDARGMESEDEGYERQAVASRRRAAVASESEGSGDNYYIDQAHQDEEAPQRKPRSPMEEEGEDEVVRDVFGDSDEDEPAPYRAPDEIDEDLRRSPIEDEEQYEKDLQPEDVVGDDNMRYESDDNLELKTKEKPVGPPLNLVVPLQQPPARPDKMNVIKVSNIMGIDPRPFDPKTYEEEDVYVTDESGTKKKIRLEDNIVRWRNVRNADGTTSVESNARFVKWKDGTMQLLIGNEVLDISVHEANHDQSHLFLRSGKGVLQSQGRLLQKLRFMPSSLSSKSHRLLTALVDSQNKKTVKMQKWFDAKDPERVKHEKEKAEGQNIRAHSLLQRKREKVSRKYTQPSRRRQLSPGFLEDALDEDEENDNHYSSRRMASRGRFEDDLEAEAQAERRIINAKKSNLSRGAPRKPSFPPSRPPRRQEYSESEREEESEYETEGEDIEHSPTAGREDMLDEEDEYEEDVEEEAAMSDEEIQEPKRKRESGASGSQRRREVDSDEDSPPRKQQAGHRRKGVVFDSDDDE
ncbi:protein LEO1 homolog [Lolium rigidum]|uniref:protein LEO1 homolog n=1 Tax=Lolium rigidum TaxID=89674 RepID=UPI001F5D27F3|nr:protein LEO1 homolog [Lolium rigidum]